jgi:hypothetical protein
LDDLNSIPVVGLLLLLPARPERLWGLTASHSVGKGDIPSGENGHSVKAATLFHLV